MAREPGEPYWLIREVGRPHGCAALDVTTALTPAGAVAEFEASLADAERDLYRGLTFEAVLMTLTYDKDGQPVVTECTT